MINIPDQKDDLDIVRLIISMGKSLHMRIVAEGVETEEQLQSLRKLGCDRPGYLIGKPDRSVHLKISIRFNMGGFSLSKIAHIYFLIDLIPNEYNKG